VHGLKKKLFFFIKKPNTAGFIAYFVGFLFERTVVAAVHIIKYGKKE